jgi:hypothetical protein
MAYAMLLRASARVTQAGVVDLVERSCALEIAQQDKGSVMRDYASVMGAGLGRTAMTSRAQTNVFSRKDTENVVAN